MMGADLFALLQKDGYPTFSFEDLTHLLPHFRIILGFCSRLENIGKDFN